MIPIEMPGELKIKYLRAAAMTAAQLLGLVRQLRQDAGDAAALRLLVRRFQGLSAFGSAYGQAAIAVIAQLGEHEGAAILRDGRRPDPAQLEQLRSFVLLLRRVVVRQRASGGGIDAILATAPPEAPGVSRENLSAASPPRRRALFVGLRDVDWTTVASRLALEDFTVRAVATCQQAGRVFAAGPPDALVAAADLPDGTGCLLAHYVRSLEGGDRPVVAIIHGPGGSCGPDELARCDVDAAFESPVNWSTVAESLADSLARRRSAPRILYLSEAGDRATSKLLDEAGYRVRCCPDPSRIARHLASFEPELVLTDLPSAAAVNDLRRCLLSDKRFAAVPVLCLPSAPAPWPGGAGPGAPGYETAAEPSEAAEATGPADLLATVAARIERTRALKRMFAADRPG